MQLSALYTALLATAVMPMVSAVPAPDTLKLAAAPVPNLQGNTLATSANSAAGQIDLATFYILWWKVWLPVLPSIKYTAYGDYGKCQNLPTVYQDTVGSIDIESASPSCWIFADLNCDGPYQESKAPGTQVYDGPAKSFICDAPAQ